MDIGSRVRARRKAHGLSQEELARRAGVTLNTISQLERGVSADPHYSTLAGLAAALDTSVADLVGESQAPLGQAPPEPRLFNNGLEEEERRALHALIRFWARWAQLFHGSFVVHFVGGLPGDPDADVVRVNIARLDTFATDFSYVEKALEEQGAYRFLKCYVDAQLVRVTGQGLGGRMTLEEADELLSRTPEDVAQAVQDIRDARAGISQNFAKAVDWVRKNAEDPEQHVKQWTETSVRLVESS